MTALERLMAPPAGVEWSPYDLHVTDPAMAIEQVESLLGVAADLGDAARYWIGDLLLFAEGRYGELAAQISDTLGLSYDQLERYRLVCERVARLRRRKWGEAAKEADFHLFWTHVQALARFDTVEEQEQWFARLLELRWSPSRLREQIREARLAVQIPRPDPEPTRPRQEVLPPEQTGDAVIGLLAVRDTLATVATALDTPEAREAVGLPAALRGLDDAGKAIKDAVGVLANRPAMREALRKFRGTWVLQQHIAEPAYIVPVAAADEFAAFVAEHYDEEGES